MAWLNNTAATTTITIDGEDYSNEFVSGQITDGSAVNTGAVMTSANLIFSELPGNSRLVDYANNKFGRGKVVLIDITLEGVTTRHPRGYLYIINSSYNMETRQMTLALGCQLTMQQLTDDIGDLSGFTIFPLPGDNPDTTDIVEKATFSNLLQAINTEGKFLWQKNDGTIEKAEFFKDDGFGSNKAAAAWVSVRDYTALNVSPLSAGQTVPDTIKISYSWNVETDTNTPTDPVTGKPYEEDLTESTYWLEHPANIKRKQRVCTTTPAGVTTCKEVQINGAKRQFSVVKTSSSIRRYGATGSSVSSESEITSGPAVEMNGSYYSELYSYKLARNNGNSQGVPLEGMNTIIQTKRERTYTYGTGGEVLQTVEKQFKTYLGAMTQNDWRAGNSETGVVYDPEDPPETATRGFLTAPPTNQMYLETQVTTTFEYFDDRTVETQVTLKSSANCNGVGVYPATGARVLQDIDATNNGIETSTKRTSMGGLLNPDQPGRNPGGNAVETKSAVFIDESAKYFPTAAGSITLTATVPYTVPNYTENQARLLASNYSKVLRNQLEGDAAGIRIAESMRPEIFSYVPGMPFTFYDRTEDKVVKLRMNSTGWAMSPGQAIFSTEGLFIGTSNGTVNIPENVDAPTLNEAFKEVVAKRDEVAEKEEEIAEETADCDAKKALRDELQAELDRRLAPPDPNTIFEVEIIQTPFIVTTGAPEPLQIFDVTVAEP